MNSSTSQNSFRSWKKDGPPSFASNNTNTMPSTSTTNPVNNAFSSPAPSRNGFQSNNAFARMNRDKQDKYSAPGMSWADHKRKLEEEAKEKEKNRPLTSADFPALAGMGPTPTPAVKVNPLSTTSSLANHIAETIKKDEETLRRRKREEEEAREKAAAEEGNVRLPLFKTMKEYLEWKNKGGIALLNLPPVVLPEGPVRPNFHRVPMAYSDEEYDGEDSMAS